MACRTTLGAASIPEQPVHSTSPVTDSAYPGDPFRSRSHRAAGPAARRTQVSVAQVAQAAPNARLIATKYVGGISLVHLVHELHIINIACV